MCSYKDRPREISLLLQTDLIKILTSNPIAQLNQLNAAQIGLQGEKSDVSDIIHKELLSSLYYKYCSIKRTGLYFSRKSLLNVPDNLNLCLSKVKRPVSIKRPGQNFF